ncbi:hypothetical protein Pcar_3188 [Syntrophotalea carbinolica DSM 2380]|uniref:Uncharacterized protein n=1 Tax=Syntrophotalea carbinolica (strain DSM 2380 / NBRC 103641 / GraBd1) TaxID=338963 RepID=Q0C6X9_SYNC1|nr:hypothetical protein Pcar_3188 [Syntrophotalea carbinolica DSM 2380]
MVGFGDLINIEWRSFYGVTKSEGRYLIGVIDFLFVQG